MDKTAQTYALLAVFITWGWICLFKVSKGFTAVTSDRITGLGSAKTLPAEAGFASELKAAIGKISENQQVARTSAQNFELGVPGVGLNDVMVNAQKSSVSLQLGIQVRNKLVAAYQEVMNMGVWVSQIINFNEKYDNYPGTQLPWHTITLTHNYLDTLWAGWKVIYGQSNHVVTFR